MTGNYKWTVVGMLRAVCFFNYADRQAFFARLPALSATFHYTPVQLGLIGSAFAWVYAAGAPFAGYAGDRIPRNWLILGGCLFWSVVTLTTGWCSQIWQFFLVRGLTGLGETVYFPAEQCHYSATTMAGARARWHSRSISQPSKPDQYGRHGADTVANMSDALAFGSVVYLFCGGLLSLSRSSP